MEEFLKLAPEPWPLETGHQWHVFLSYRSTERKWVLALYDILTKLNYQVFMDQFVLVAGEGLATALGENLRASESGVLVWSPRNEDSAWCKKEYNTFEARNANGKFPFVTVRLGNARLPDFVQGAFWLDCSDQRDRPSGDTLLRLLYGLHNKPLPPEAVAVAAAIDETTRKDLATLRVHTDGKDADAIVALTAQRKDHIAWQYSPALPCAAAQALVSIGSPKKALEILAVVRAAFPAAIRPRQLAGWALARSRNWKDAKAVLGELYEIGERDPETVGIYARTWMDAYEATGDRLLLRRSRDLYAEAFAAVPTNYYNGINAAAKSIFLNEIDAGIRMAAAVEALVGTQPKAGDYWQTATVAEAQLIQRNYALAATRYGEAVAMSPGAVDDHRSSCKQARLLLKHLGATPDQMAQVLAVFRREVNATDARSAVQGVRAQGYPRVLTFTGFSSTGYEDNEALCEAIHEELDKFSPDDTLVCAGGTAEGIGAVYPVALKRGFRTAGIVSAQVRADGVKFSNECEVVFVVDDASWGGKQENGKLSPTSRAMVDACDVIVGIGGGAIARDELEEARAKGKDVRFHFAAMNHQLAREKALKAGKAPPTDFDGEAATLFT